MDPLAHIVGFNAKLQVADIGAAFLGEQPPYKSLLDRGLAHLHAFDAEERTHHALRIAHGEDVTVHPEIVGDGESQTLHIAANPESGMTSLLKPSQSHLMFFNGFDNLGAIKETKSIKTTRLDDISILPNLDYLKMDIQGSELQALKSGEQKLENCVAIQLEISFVPLYENQPSFGEIDVWMRSNGFMPHCFAAVKPWSIAPTIKNNDMRQPFNQLLEADIVYVRNPIESTNVSIESWKKLVLISHYCYSSFDLAVYLLKKLEAERAVHPSALNTYLEMAQAPPA